MLTRRRLLQPQQLPGAKNSIVLNALAPAGDLLGGQAATRTLRGRLHGASERISASFQTEVPPRSTAGGHEVAPAPSSPQ